MRFLPLFSMVYAVPPVLKLCAFVRLPSFADFSETMLEKLP
jgi:hypothetical protein